MFGTSAIGDRRRIVTTGLLQFETSEKRAAFLAIVKKERPDIFVQLKPAFSEPTLIARTDSLEKLSWLADRVVSFGEFLPDEKLSLFAF
jgi:hypothetical protein